MFDQRTRSPSRSRRRGVFGVWLALAAATLINASAAGGADAKYVAQARVRYTSDKTVSDWIDVEVIFVTGAELNEASNTTTRDPARDYAVVYWAANRATVIQLVSPVACGAEFDQACMPASGQLRGLDSQGRSWEVCTAKFCF